MGQCIITVFFNTRTLRDFVASKPPHSQGLQIIWVRFWMIFRVKEGGDVEEQETTGDERVASAVTCSKSGAEFEAKVAGKEFGS